MLVTATWWSWGESNYASPRTAERHPRNRAEEAVVSDGLLTAATGPSVGKMWASRGLTRSRHTREQAPLPGQMRVPSLGVQREDLNGGTTPLEAYPQSLVRPIVRLIERLQK
jgi:hypothetical protein